MAADDLGDDLVRRAVAGDQAALNVLLLRCYDETLRRIRRRMPMDLEKYVDPDDVLQEAFADVFRGIASIEQVSWSGFVGWLRVVVDNRMQMIRRRHVAARRKPVGRTVDLTETELLLQAIVTSSQSPGSWLVRKEHLGALLGAMELLDTPRRDVLRMRFVEGKSYDQIATEVGKNVGAVRMLTFRCLRYLRAQLDDDSSTPVVG